MASQRCPLGPTRFHSSYFSYHANGRITALAPQCSESCIKCRKFGERWHRHGRSFSDGTESSLSTGCEALKGLRNFNWSATSARKVKSSYSDRMTLECPRRNQLQPSIPISSAASVAPGPQSLWLLPQVEGSRGAARRRRLRLEFTSVKGRNRYAQLINKIEAAETRKAERKQIEKLRMKWKINFREGTIRTRYSISYSPHMKAWPGEDRVELTDRKR